jgi:hypothetical protein
MIADLLNRSRVCVNRSHDQRATRPSYGTLVVGCLLVLGACSALRADSANCYWYRFCKVVSEETTTGQLDCVNKGNTARCVGQIVVFPSSEACAGISQDENDAIQCCLVDRTPGYIVYDPQIQATNLSTVAFYGCVMSTPDCAGCILGIIATFTTGPVGVVTFSLAASGLAIDCGSCGYQIAERIACCTFKCVRSPTPSGQYGTRQGC